MPPIGATQQLKTLASGLAVNSPTGIKTDAYGLNWQQGNPAAPSSYHPTDYSAEIAALQAESSRLNAQLAAQPKLLPFDYAGTQAKARAAAESAVNPLYTKMWNDYLGQAKVQQARQVADTGTANSLLQDNLKNIQDTNAITGARTAQDVQTNTDALNTGQTNYQADTGLNFDRARTALATNIAQGGTTESGLGQQQVAGQQTARNVQEGRQVMNFNDQRTAQQLLKTRTFEDLARSNELATKQTGQNTTANNLNLARYIADYGADEGNYGYNTKQQQQSIEQQRLGAVLTNQGQQYGNLFNQYLGSLQGARGQDLALTRSVYGV